jgi:hypothetical protein
MVRPSGVTNIEAQKWRNVLGKTKEPPPKYNSMDVDTIQIEAMTTEEKTKLQKEGKCFFCKRQGHISKNCPNKKKDRNAPCPAPQNAKVCAVEIDEGEAPTDLKEAMVQQISLMSTEERNALLDNLVLQGFLNARIAWPGFKC